MNLEQLENRNSSRKKDLLKQKHILHNRMSRMSRLNKLKVMVLIAWLVLMILFPIELKKTSSDPIVSELAHNSTFILVISIIMGVMLSMILISLLPPRTDFLLILQEIDNELDLLDIKESSLEERAEKLFKQHHIELKRYYDQNLKQSSLLFKVGIGCICMGFIIIAITIFLVSTNISAQTQIIIASVGGIGAILSNFIAAIYMKMHTDTEKSLTQFHHRFVNTHHYHFANFLISKVKNSDRREKALVDLALNISNESFNRIDK